MLSAIGKPLSEDRKSFWMLNGLGSNYQMFTTMTLRPPLPEYSQLLSMLHSYEIRIRLQESVVTSQYIGFVANMSKAKQAPPKFTFEHRGFTVAASSSNLAYEMENKPVLNSSSAKPTTQFVRTEELKDALMKFKFVCLIRHKPGHSAHRCFKRFNTPILKADEKNVQLHLVLFKLRMWTSVSGCLTQVRRHT